MRLISRESITIMEDVVTYCVSRKRGDEKVT